MKSGVANLSEKDVQRLIADYPWLLNIDYISVPEFKDKGMEYMLSGNKRADLILKDRSSGCPVIVEFKAVPFYRENIGQVLEYKARVISEVTNENSQLRDVFGDRTLTPIMVLVVPTCDVEARLACNMSGIIIYEYEASVPEIAIPENKVTLEEFHTKFDSKEIPFDVDRHLLVEKVYEDIQGLLMEENSTDGWVSYRSPAGEYFTSMNQVFVNKWIFQNREISIGICENIFDNTHFDKISVEYFSYNSELLMTFMNKYKELDLKPINDCVKIDGTYYEGFIWSFAVDKAEFFNKTKELIRPFIRNYVKVYKTL